MRKCTAGAFLEALLLRGLQSIRGRRRIGE